VEFSLFSNAYALRWTNWAEFEIWLRQEQVSKGIELLKKNVQKGKSGMPWLQWHESVCARQGSGSQKKYVPKNPEQQRNIPSKRSGCPCHLTVKMYSDTCEILGMYNGQHSHGVADENIKFTCLSKESKGQITNLLELGVESDRIVRDNLDCLNRSKCLALSP
jgi:hypothetical protein